jgi:hypothetical protein
MVEIVNLAERRHAGCHMSSPEQRNLYGAIALDRAWRRKFFQASTGTLAGAAGGLWHGWRLPPFL